MQLKKGQIVELVIHAIAFGGRGIGKYEGLTVFVPDTMPGDRVEAAFTRLKKKYAEADLIKIIEKSIDRVEPPCPHFEKCGGCQLQYMPYEKQLEFKKQHVIDAFQRIGKIYDVEVKDVIPSADIFYYRNKMEFSFGYDEEMNFTFGLHIPGRRFDILDVHSCMLMSPQSMTIVNAVRDFCVEKGWEARKYLADEGFLKSMFIREGKHTNQVMVNLLTSEEVPENFDRDAEDFVKMLNALDLGEKKIVSIYWMQKICKRGTPTKIIDKLLYGSTVLEEKMILKNGDELTFEILPQAFFQVNTTQAEILYSQVVDLVGDGHEMIFDLYCGTGTIGMFLAKCGQQVLGIDISKSAIEAARSNARKNGIFNIDFFDGDAAKVLETIKQRPSLIVLDPPRAGLIPKMIEQINAFDCKKIVYVSCNPSTLARDCLLLSEYGYEVKSVQPVDMFPHSYHVESVVSLEKS